MANAAVDVREVRDETLVEKANVVRAARGDEFLKNGKLKACDAG